MRKIISLIFLTLLPFYTFATDHSSGGMAALDFYSCSFNKGKNMADLRKLDAEYVEWAKENYQPFMSYILTPYVADSSDWDFDLLWLDIFKNHEGLGLSTQAWTENASELEKKFNRVWNCDSRATATSIAFQPFEALGKEAFLTIHSCMLNNGRTYDDLMAANAAWVDHRKDVGIEDAMYLWSPDAGWAREDKTDFLTVYVAEDMAMRGRTMDKLWAGSGSVYNRIYDDVKSCDKPRVWLASPVGGQNY